MADSFGKSFGRKVVLKAATVWAQAGRISCVLGRNGSGKSTLLRCALGLSSADHGFVRYRGGIHLRPRLWRLAAEGLFYLPDKDLLSRRMTLGAQLALLAGRFGLPEPAWAVERLGASDLLDAYPSEMSGGERRRAELSMALARRPRCLIADEPLSEVEPKDRGVVGLLLRELAASGAAVLVTGHEVRDLLALSDDVIWMTAGTTHGLGTPTQARTHDQFRREYLGPALP